MTPFRPMHFIFFWYVELVKYLMPEVKCYFLHAESHASITVSILRLRRFFERRSVTRKIITSPDKIFGNNVMTFLKAAYSAKSAGRKKASDTEENPLARIMAPAIFKQINYLIIFYLFDMKNKHADSSRDVSLREENEFLKIKMMLESGAQFSDPEKFPPIDPGIENKLLHNIMEFERQFAQQKIITVFEKIKRPSHFLPVATIADQDIDKSWDDLYRYMLQYGIELDVCTPNVNHRELYRFATEELFLQEIDDIDIEGIICNFIYDDFYPDYKYDNTRAALEGCISCIFGKNTFDWMHYFRKNDLRLNSYFNLAEVEFKNYVLAFQSSFSALMITKLKESSCEIAGNNCRISGLYAASGKRGGMRVSLKGNWMVEFELHPEMDCWQIVNVQIDGIQF